MGSKTPFVTTREAADLLGVSTVMIYGYVRTGKLKSCTRQCGGEKVRNHLFHRADIECLLKARAAKRLHPVPVNSILAQTAITAAKCRELEVKVNGLLELLGGPYTTIDLTENGVHSIFRKVNAIRNCRNNTADSALWLAYTVYHLDENFLIALEQFELEPEPWVPLLQAVQRLQTQLAGRPDSYTKAVHEYLCIARRHLRAVAFEYVRMAHGFRKAEQLAEQEPDRADAIICSIMLRNIQAIHARRATHP